MLAASFLRLFPQFRALLAENAALREAAVKSEAQVLQLQDRIDAAYEDRNRLWSLVENSISKMETSYQMHVNVEWQKQGRGAPYPNAPQLPLNKVPEEREAGVVPRPLTMSEQMARGTNEFIQNYLSKHSTPK